MCSSVNVGSTKAGINMDAVALMGRTVKAAAERTADCGGFGCAKLVVFCNAVEDNPFMAGAFHGVGEPERVINVGVSGPGVVYHALQSVKGQPFDVVAETVKKTAFRITRMGQLVAQEASRRLNTPFGIVDLSLAPTPAVGDSVARILEEMGLEVCGTHGTTAALALLNDAVKKGGVMASNHVGGLSGAFIPVSEDEGMIAAAERGTLALDKLEDVEVLALDTACGIYHEDAHIAVLDAADRAHHAVELQILAHLILASDACRIDEIEVEAEFVIPRIDAVARGARYVGHDVALFSDKGIDETRLARIGTSHHGKAWDILVRQLSGLLREESHDQVKQVARAASCSCRYADRVSQAQRIELRCQVLLVVVGLVTCQHHRFLCASEYVGNSLIKVGHTIVGIHQEENHVGLIGGQSHLLAYLLLKDIV